MIDINIGLLQRFLNFLIKSPRGTIMPEKQLAEVLYKPIVGKFEKRKVYSSFKDNFWGAD